MRLLRPLVGLMEVLRSEGLLRLLRLLRLLGLLTLFLMRSCRVQ